MPIVPITRPVADKLAYQGKPSSPALRGSRQRFRYWYDHIIDWMLVNPGKPMADCAKVVGRSLATIYIVTNTDIFKARLADRRNEYNARLSTDIAAASSNVALLALGELSTRLSENAAKIPIGIVADIADKALNRLGYGVAPVVNAPVTVTANVVVSPLALREAQEKMRTVQELNSRDITPQAPPTRHLSQGTPLDELDDFITTISSN